jgi:hypothetical protein
MMNQEISSDLKAEDSLLLQLGFNLGQNHTLGMLAGRCSAAQAQILRSLREEKLYRRCCRTWDDFCAKYVKMSRSEADRIIKLLEEFGPAYFELSQVIRISPVVYRAIAPAVSDGVLHHNGEAIALTAENSEKVAAVVAEMRSALPKKSAEPNHPALDLKQRIDGLAERCVAMVAKLDRTCVEDLGLTCTYLRNELMSLRDQILRVAA